MNLLLCYPRSGSTFTRYIIEVLTGVGTLGPPYSFSSVDLPLLHHRETPTSAISAIRIHREEPRSRKVASVVEKKGWPLILIIRNPIELPQPYMEIKYVLLRQGKKKKKLDIPPIRR